MAARYGNRDGCRYGVAAGLRPAVEPGFQPGGIVAAQIANLLHCRLAAGQGGESTHPQAPGSTESRPTRKEGVAGACKLVGHCFRPGAAPGDRPAGNQTCRSSDGWLNLEPGKTGNAWARRSLAPPTPARRKFRGADGPTALMRVKPPVR